MCTHYDITELSTCANHWIMWICIQQTEEALWHSQTKNTYLFTNVLLPTYCCKWLQHFTALHNTKRVNVDTASKQAGSLSHRDSSHPLLGEWIKYNEGTHSHFFCIQHPPFRMEALMQQYLPPPPTANSIRKRLGTRKHLLFSTEIQLVSNLTTSPGIKWKTSCSCVATTATATDCHDVTVAIMWCLTTFRDHLAPLLMWSAVPRSCPAYQGGCIVQHIGRKARDKRRWRRQQQRCQTQLRLTFQFSPVN